LGFSGKRWSENWSLDQLCPAHPLATGAVKQDRVAIGFPNRGQLDASRAVQAEKNSAWTAAANQNSLCNTKGTYLQFILLANRIVNVTSKIV
jgi:hypothetical protein